MSAVIIQFPSGSRSAPEINGQLALELEGLARLLHQRTNRRTGQPVTLEQARAAAKDAFLSMQHDRCLLEVIR